MFWSCEELKNIDLSNFNTENVIDMEEMFYRCENLQILDLSSFDLSNVENLNSMFGYCSKLENVKFPESGKCTPETAEDVFKNCGNLKEAKLPNFDFKDTDVSYMFLGCSELERVDFSNTTINNTASVAGIFRNCSGLTELVVNDNSNIYDLKRMAKEVDSDDIKIAFRGKKMSLEDINEELRDAMREENLKTIDDKLQDEVRSLIKKYYLKGEDKELFINAVNEVFSESEEKINQFRTTNLFD